jgi:hypothetical protein
MKTLAGPVLFAVGRAETGSQETRARWKEQPTDLRHWGAVGQNDLSDILDEDLERQQASLAQLPEQDRRVLELLSVDLL